MEYGKPKALNLGESIVIVTALCLGGSPIADIERRLMSPDALKNALLKDGPHQIYTKVFVGALPTIFATTQAYEDWRAIVADSAKIPAGDVKLTGSAHVGFSLAPEKFGRPFSRVSTDERPASDLDVALINERLFITGWNAVVDHNYRRGFGLSYEEKIKLHQDVYYGFLPDKFIPRGTSPSRKILSLRGATGLHPTSSGLTTNVRLYRRDEDFFGYQVASLRLLRTNLSNI